MKCDPKWVASAKRHVPKDCAALFIAADGVHYGVLPKQKEYATNGSAWLMVCALVALSDSPEGRAFRKKVERDARNR